MEYLARRGWSQKEGAWSCAASALGPFPLKRAVHLQLTDDLCWALAPAGWKVVGYSPRGYAQLQDAGEARPCSLPAALRRQAKREGRPVADFSYSLFLAAMLDGA
jgi:hypothetical protein